MEKKNTTPTKEVKVNWQALEEYFIFCFGGFDASQSAKNIVCFTAELILREEVNATWMAKDFSELNFFLQALDQFIKDNQGTDWKELSKQKNTPTIQ